MPKTPLPYLAESRVAYPRKIGRTPEAVHHGGVRKSELATEDQ